MIVLYYVVCQGYVEIVLVLLEGGVDIDQMIDGDCFFVLFVVMVNGNFDVVMVLLDWGVNLNFVSVVGVVLFYVVVNVQWVLYFFYFQLSFVKVSIGYFELMQVFIDCGVEVDVCLKIKVWYIGFNFDQLGVDESGVMVFWCVVQLSDFEVMQLFV